MSILSWFFGKSSGPRPRRSNAVLFGLTRSYRENPSMTLRGLWPVTSNCEVRFASDSLVPGIFKTELLKCLRSRAEAGDRLEREKRRRSTRISQIGREPSITKRKNHNSMYSIV